MNWCHCTTHYFIILFGSSAFSPFSAINENQSANPENQHIITIKRIGVLGNEALISVLPSQTAARNRPNACSNETANSPAKKCRIALFIGWNVSIQCRK